MLLLHILILEGGRVLIYVPVWLEFFGPKSRWQFENVSIEHLVKF